jgi:hypothetical protein
MTDHEFPPIADTELATITGGARAGSWNPFSFLAPLYHKVVFGFASHVGGNKLAEKMYGSHTTARDKARAQAAMKQFLVAGGKLPKGVPNLFG